MKASQFLQILKLTKTTIEEYKNWGEQDIHKGQKEKNLVKKDPTKDKVRTR
jgi:uncharacterized HAD superfamily protein